jgi:hypothetical protein
MLHAPGSIGNRFMWTNKVLPIGAAVCVAAMTLFAETWSVRAGPADLAAHRAIYELKLAQSRSKSGAVSARGRILYDFSGNACDGYNLDFRQVSELDNGEGKVTLSDLRSHSWEDGGAQAFTFNSQNYLNERLIEAVDGRAERRGDGVAVALTKPKSSDFVLNAAVIFPTEHVRRILAAAREGKTVLEFPVYDGSETGAKVYNTLSVIGRQIAPDDRAAHDAAAGQPALAGMARWPVTVSYFDKTNNPGEQLPVYAISFELYENGISRALMLDYNDFAISGELTQLEIKNSKACP